MVSCGSFYNKCLKEYRMIFSTSTIRNEILIAIDPFFKNKQTKVWPPSFEKYFPIVWLAIHIVYILHYFSSASLLMNLQWFYHFRNSFTLHWDFQNNNAIKNSMKKVNVKREFFLVNQSSNNKLSLHWGYWLF